MKIDEYIEIDGIKCYSKNSIFNYSDYPGGGFDFMENKAAKSFWIRSRDRLFKKIIYKYFPANESLDLLEVGCGTGSFKGKLATDKRLRITGSEIYHKGLIYAKKNYPEVNFIQYSVLDNTLSSRFDGILAFDVLEHIEDDNLALANIHSLLKDGGLFIMTVPQHKFLWGRLDVIVRHKRRYQRSDLIRKMITNGFKIKYATSFVFALFPLMWLSRIFDKGKTTFNSNEEIELENRLVLNPFVNWLFDSIMKIDELLINLGVSLPFGGTLIVIARK
jgi:SAM-dependent methyltransferase